jgi:hypothetical protein
MRALSHVRAIAVGVCVIGSMRLLVAAPRVGYAD